MHNVFRESRNYGKVFVNNHQVHEAPFDAYFINCSAAQSNVRSQVIYAGDMNRTEPVYLMRRQRLINIVLEDVTFL